MNEFIELALTVLMWYVIAMALFHLVIKPWLIRRLETSIGELEKAMVRSADNAVEVKVEEHHGQFYLFDKNTDVFLAQGYDAKEIASKMQKSLQVYITVGDPDVIERFKATVPSNA